MDQQHPSHSHSNSHNSNSNNSKHIDNANTQDSTNMKQSHHSHNKDRHIKWDEQKLKQTQQYRGTFEKITQPKTPYHSNSQEEEQEDNNQVKTQQQIQVEQSLRLAHKNKDCNRKPKVDLASINAKLKEEMIKYKEEAGESMEPQQQETQQQLKKKQEFNKKRAAHYNQFQKIQQMKNRKWSSDQDD